MVDLAIIIPAFKARFFDRALQSLADQTDKNFNVYVGDDCSPEDLKRICDRFEDRISIAYTRFDANVGAKRLVDQWSRCVALAKDEPWLWVFSDDDILDRDCVENFHLHLAATRGKFDVYRFNTKVIDGAGTVTSVCPHGPEVETSAQMTYHLLMRRRGNSMGDHIFSRDVYVRCGGFVFTEYAQGADWAMSISFSRFRGISIVPGSYFYWRFSGANISARGARAKRDMVNGHLQFLRWVIGRFEPLQHRNEDVSFSEMLAGVRYNLSTLLVGHYHGLGAGNFLRVLGFLRRDLKLSRREALLDVFYVVKHTNSLVMELVRAKRWVSRALSGKAMA